MLIKQLSIFLENKKGRFTEVTRILGDAGINMSAFTVSENSDFGILRLIVSDPQKAKEILREKQYAVTTTDVVCVCTPNKAGSLSPVMELITEAGIYVEYMYAFSFGDGARIIIRPDDVEKTLQVLADNKINLLAASDLFAV
ncbi:amino acid-binding protein [Bacteroidales bacterium OttesenSCG-928-J19]|nr:amino acid-binding protein [Bacteroidales bacterium OttesenSCG-928-J19]